MSNRNVIPRKVADRCMPVDYSRQHLGGHLGRALDTNLQRGLMRIAYDDYLDAYEKGMPALWPSGEYLGKFMHGLVKMARYTGDPRIYAQMQAIVNTWVDKQGEDGYLGTSPTGYLVGEKWDFWGLWDHKYTLMGLLTYLSLVDHGPAMDCARRIGDLLCRTFSEGDDPRGLRIQAHTGMADGSVLEAMVRLYRATGNPRYLAFCNRVLELFEMEGGPRIVSELTERSGRVDKVGNGKGYEMLSCIVGILRMYHLTGEAQYLKTATAAWDDIAANRLYITGTSSIHELFVDNGHLPAGMDVNMGEGCVTAHWVYLSRLLFYLTGETRYIDEIEKAVYNHLLGSQHPRTAYQSYYTPLIGTKLYDLPNIHCGQPPCCISSVQRCIARIPEVVWTRFVDNGMAVLMYNPGWMKDSIATADGDRVAVELTVDSDYPARGEAALTVNPGRTATFRLGLRVPGWSRDFRAVCNGGEPMGGEPGTMVDIEREWRPGDRIAIAMDMNDRLVEGGPAYTGHYAFLRGPLVMALGGETNVGLDQGQAIVDPSAGAALTPAADRLPANWVGSQAYTSPALRGPDDTPPLLVPFADTGQIDRRATYRVWIKGA